MLEPDFSPFPELRTGRLLLRRIAETDAREILAMRSTETVMQYIDRETMKTLEDADTWIKLITASLDANAGITWAIALAEDPKTLIGTIGFWKITNKHYRAEIGYMLSPLHWKKGITREALEAVIAYGFGPMQLHSIEGRINPANAASAALLESAGFTREAYYREDYFFKGQFLDTAVYSRLAG